MTYAYNPRKYEHESEGRITMEAMKIDFTGVKGQKTFDPLKAGKYIVEVTDYRESEAGPNAKNAGAPMISWELTVESLLDGDTEYVDRAGEEVNVEGRKVWENMTITEGSFWRLKSFLEAAGFEAEGEIDFDPDAVLNSRMVVALKVDPKRKNKETGDEYPARNSIKTFHTLESEGIESE